MELENKSDKRDFERCGCEASAEVSIFNQIHSYNARIVNVSADGMCFQSHHFLQPGVTVCIRLKDFQSVKTPGCGEIGLRSLCLAQVKWCHEPPEAEDGSYDVGVKYQAPQY